jgi:hypothetical protein
MLRISAHSEKSLHWVVQSHRILVGTTSVESKPSPHRARDYGLLGCRLQADALIEDSLCCETCVALCHSDDQRMIV